MKVAYVSPFSPDKSGVADFAEELIPELSQYMNITIFPNHPVENEDIKNNFEELPIEALDEKSIREGFDFILYQVGNNWWYHKKVIDCYKKYPSILEIHDLSLHYFLAEDTYIQKNGVEYARIMEYCHGELGKKAAEEFLNGKTRAPWETDSDRFTVNKHLIDSAKGIIVHSDYAKEYVKGIRSDVPVINIPLHTPMIFDDFKEYQKNCRKELNLDEELLVMGSFGYATVAKRIEPILKALSIIAKENSNFIYYIVGEVQGINVEKVAARMGIKDNVIVTGFVEMDDFNTYMGACDFCFNLRYPTQGESSASLHRMLGMGKPALVTNIGSFEEYSDDYVMKIRSDENEVNDIVKAIKTLMFSKDELAKRSEKALLFAKSKCDIKENARRYYYFLESLNNEAFQDDYEDSLLDVLQELDLLDENYLKTIVSNFLE